jgi:hypothetical protein
MDKIYMVNNFTANTIQQQLATRSGQIGISNQNGTYSFVDINTGKTIAGRSLTASLLANPQRINDPKLKSQALDSAKGYFDQKNVPQEMIEGFASVAAYVSATTGTPVQNLFSNGKINMQLIAAYNSFKPKGSQVGVFVGSGSPSWVNNPVLRGTVASAIVDQP